MKSKYSFEKKARHLYMSISGEYDQLDFISYLKIISDECEKEKTYEIVINALDVKGTDLSTMQRFLLGEEIAKILKNKIKAAIVWPEKDINKFAETVAVNRGANLHVFGDLETAEIWLMK